MAFVGAEMFSKIYIAFGGIEMAADSSMLFRSVVVDEEDEKRGIEKRQLEGMGWKIKRGADAWGSRTG